MNGLAYSKAAIRLHIRDAVGFGWICAAMAVAGDGAEPAIGQRAADAGTVSFCCTSPPARAGASTATGSGCQHK